METRAGDDLYQVIADIAQIAVAAQDRLNALEQVLKEKNPTLFQAYRDQLKKQGPTASISREGLQGLVERLARG